MHQSERNWKHSLGKHINSTENRHKLRFQRNSLSDNASQNKQTNKEKRTFTFFKVIWWSLVLDCSTTSWMHPSFCYGWALSTLCYMDVSLPMGLSVMGIIVIYLCSFLSHFYLWRFTFIYTYMAVFIYGCLFFTPCPFFRWFLLAKSLSLFQCVLSLCHLPPRRHLPCHSRSTSLVSLTSPTLSTNQMDRICHREGPGLICVQEWPLRSQADVRLISSGINKVSPLLLLLLHPWPQTNAVIEQQCIPFWTWN